MFPGNFVDCCRVPVNFPWWVPVLHYRFFTTAAHRHSGSREGLCSKACHMVCLCFCSQDPSSFPWKSHWASLFGHRPSPLSFCGEDFSFPLPAGAGGSWLRGAGSANLQTVSPCMYSVASLFFRLSRVLLLSHCGTWHLSSRLLTFHLPLGLWEYGVQGCQLSTILPPYPYTTFLNPFIGCGASGLFPKLGYCD
jgi:hypothetical protein